MRDFAWIVLSSTAHAINFGATRGQLINAGNNTVSSTLQGSARLRKFGDGTLTLTGNSSYTGPTRISDGALVVAAAGVIGAAPDNTVTLVKARDAV